MQVRGLAEGGHVGAVQRVDGLPAQAQREFVARQRRKTAAHGVQAAPVGARQAFVLQQKSQRQRCRHRLAHGVHVCLHGVGRTQDAAPLDVLERLQIRARDEQIGGAHVDDARGHVGAFDVVAEAQQFPGCVVQHVLGQEPFELLGSAADAIERFAATAARSGRLQGAASVKVQLGDVFEGDARHRLADVAHVLPRHCQRADDGTWIANVGGHEAADIAFAGFGILAVEFLEQPLRTADVHKRSPAERPSRRQVHQQMAVHGNQSRRGIGPLDVAAQPIDPLGHAREDVGVQRCGHFRRRCSKHDGDLPTIPTSHGAAAHPKYPDSA